MKFTKATKVKHFKTQTVCAFQELISVFKQTKEIYVI